MTIGSGLGGSVGIAAESVYGTYLAPSKHHEVNKADFKKVKNTVQGGGLAAGRMVQPGSRRVVTSEGGSGSMELEVGTKSLGLLLQNIFGTTVTPTQQGVTSAYLQAHTLGDNYGKSLTVQSGIPDTGGTVRPYTFLGGKITSAEFACSVDSLLMLTPEFDFRQVVESQTLAAPSYPTGIAPFHHAQMVVKVGDYGSEAAVAGVRGFSVKLERGQATDRYYASGAGLKAEPVMNDWVKVSGSFDVDFVDKTVFHDRFASDASTSVIIEFVGANIASTYYQTFRLKLPQTFFDGDSPILDGPGVVSGSIPFVAEYDLTHSPIACDYISTDTTV